MKLLLILLSFSLLHGELKASPDGSSEERLVKKLLLAAKHNNIRNLKWVISRDVNLNAMIPEYYSESLKKYVSMSALMIASKQGHLDFIKLLLTHKAEINLKNNVGHNALTYALLNGEREVFEYLLEQGADPNTKEDNTNFTLLDLLAGLKEASKNPNGSHEWNADYDECARLIVGLISPEVVKETPGVFLFTEEITKVQKEDPLALFDFVSSIKAHDQFALIDAVNTKNFSLIELHILNGADFNETIMVNFQEETAFTLAASLGLSKVIDLFLKIEKEGSPVYLKNEAFKKAIMAGHFEVAKTIESSGVEAKYIKELIYHATKNSEKSIFNYFLLNPTQYFSTEQLISWVEMVIQEKNHELLSVLDAKIFEKYPQIITLMNDAFNKAVKTGDQELIASILSSELPLNFEDKFVTTAIKTGLHDLMKILLQTDRIKDFTKVRFSYMPYHGRYYYKHTNLLMIAVEENKLSIVKLLLDHGLDPNFILYKWSRVQSNLGHTSFEQNEETSVLLEAVMKDHVEMIEVLLQHNAYVNEKIILAAQSHSTFTLLTSEISWAMKAYYYAKWWASVVW